MADVTSTPASNRTRPPAVTDHRPVPRGVLPRGVQTWLMVGLARRDAGDHADRRSA